MINEPSNEPVYETPPGSGEDSAAPGPQKNVPVRGDKKWWIILAILGGLLGGVLIIDSVLQSMIRDNKEKAEWTSYDLGNGSSICTDLIVSKQDRVWIGISQSGCNIFIMDASGKKTIPEKIASSDVQDIAIDKEGKIWISAWGDNEKGIYLYSPEGDFANFFPMEIYPEALAIDQEGKLWVVGQEYGTVKEILVLNSDGTWKHYPAEGEISSDASDMAIDAKGRAWIATRERKILDSNGNWTTFSSEIISPSALLFVEDQNQMWIGEGWSGLEILDSDGNQINRFTGSNSDFVNNQVTSLAVDKEGRVWIGSYGTLSMIDPNGNWLTYTPDNSGMAGRYVVGIGFDSHGKVWVAIGVEQEGTALETFDPRVSTPNDGLKTQTQIASFTKKEVLPLLEVLIFLTIIKLLIAPVKKIIKIIELHGRSREASFLAGFLGWYLINGLIWLGLGNPVDSEYIPNLLIFPINLLALIILSVGKRTRNVGLGILAALALNLLLSLILGALMNGVCFVPFYYR